MAAILAASTRLCFAQSQADDNSPQELRDEVRQLRSEVKDLHAELEAQKAASPQTQAEIAKVTDEVIKDAERRTTLIEQSDMTAGYLPDKGFVMRSEDGNFLLHPSIFMQVRGTANYREHTPGVGGNGGGSDSEFGFEIPRLKLIFDGNVMSPATTYQFIWATNETTGNLGLQDAWARHHFAGTEFALRAGNIREPLDHEQIMYSSRTMTPDRSIVNGVLLNNDTIVKGVSLEYNYDNPNAAARAVIAFTGGLKNFDTNFQSFPTNGSDWGAAARVEWKLMGDWKDYAQFTALGDKQPLLVLGAGADYTESGDTGALTHVIDAQYNLPQGLGLYAAYLGRYTKHNGGLPNTTGGAVGAGSFPDTYDTTVRLMASWLIHHRWEPFARYEYLDFDGSDFPAGVSNHVVQDITIGCNYYLLGQHAKFSAGVSYLPNGSPIGSPMADILVTDGGEEILVQAQFQLVL